VEDGEPGGGAPFRVGQQEIHGHRDQAAQEEGPPGRDPHAIGIGRSTPDLTGWTLQAAATAAEQEQHEQHDDDDQQQGTEPHLASLRVERRLPVRG
jgi:hypothetical protein